MTKKQWLLIPALVMLFGLMPQASWAYNDDVHFNLTYVLCRLAGLPQKDSLWIADADQSMDENKCTTAFSGGWDATKQYTGIEESVWQRNGRNWHAFTDEGINSGLKNPLVTATYSDPKAARKSVKEQLDFLWNVTLHNTPNIASAKRNQVIEADIAMGQFLHFEQDYFAHRQMTGYLDDNSWLPFGTLVGHAWIGDTHTPDYVAARPDLANLMIQDSYTYICSYVLALYGHDNTQASKGASPDDLLKIIKDLAAAYPRHIEHINTGSQQGKLGNTPIVNKTIIDGKPTQAQVNQALNSALADTGHINILSTDLPEFYYALPYDKPGTPLNEVEANLGAD